MVHGCHESTSQLASHPPTLFKLAEKLCSTPGGFDRYDYAKCVWLGSPDREKRLTGDHPWPKRIHGGEKYVYSVPVLAAANAEIATMMFVSKDSWKSVNDPNAWLVAERGLLGGEEIEHKVLSASVDAANDLRLSLAPASYDNFPPEMKWAFKNRPSYDQTILSGRLDERYNLRSATVREGLDGGTVAYEDIEALESMIIVVQQIRAAQMEAERNEVREFEYALASRALYAA